MRFKRVRFMSVPPHRLANSSRRRMRRAAFGLRGRSRRSARRFVDRVLAPPSLWHLTMPGFDRLLELRWRAMIRRARVYTPEEHAAAFADVSRRGAAIEVPIGCQLCGGRRL